VFCVMLLLLSCKREGETRGGFDLILTDFSFISRAKTCLYKEMELNGGGEAKGKGGRIRGK
jgi:hypothetical protein